jgi:hypothetical protein
MKRILLLCIVSAFTALGASVDITVTATDADQLAVTRFAKRINSITVAEFVASHPGVVLSTNGVTVSGTVDGSPVGSVTLKTLLGLAREIWSSALAGVKRQEDIEDSKKADAKMKARAAAFNAANLPTQIAIDEALGIAP